MRDLWLLPCPDPCCGALAEVADRVTVGSTHGPVEHIRTLCLAGHRFVMPASRACPAPPSTAVLEPTRSESGRSG
jgi:hypothetical protein